MPMPAVVSNGSSVGGSLGGLLNKVSIGGGDRSWNAFGRRGSDGPAVVSNGEVASGVTAPAGPSNGIYRSSPPPDRRASMPVASPLSAPPQASSSGRAFPPPLEPRNYTILKEVGDGSFGTVWLADWHSQLHLPPGTLPPGPSSRPEYKGKKLVAIKRMKKAFEGGWAECMQLKELKSLQQIPMHANIIPLYDAFLLPSTRELYFVFECMEGNLYQLTKSRKGRPLASGLVGSIFFQILSGLDHIHRNGYFHRDMKPENLLITTTGLADYPASSLYALPGTAPEKDVVVTVKLADFGLARETSSRPPYTEYVSTRWYRAPEVLLRSREYSNPVDMWALGTIMVEILTLKPMFPGDSEVDQVFKICEVLGDPCPDYGVDERRRTRGGGPWSKGVKMATQVGFAFPKIAPKSFATLFDTNVVPIQLIDCIADMLRYEPKMRLTTQQCLDSAYFREVAYRYAPFRPPSLRTPTTSSSQAAPSIASSHRNGSSLSISTMASTHIPPMPSPREVPPSHSNRHAADGQPPFRSHDPNQQLPPPAAPSYRDSPATSPANVPRHDSDASMVSGMSGYAMHVNPPVDDSYDSPMAYPESVSERTSASTRPSSLWSGPVDSNWSANTRPAPSFGATLGRRGSFTSIAPSVAASTFYDGSVYEGVGNNRAASVMSFPFGNGNGDQGSPIFDDSPTMGGNSNGIFNDAASIASTSSHHAPSLAPSQSAKSSRWGGFGKAFSSSSATPVASSSASIMSQQSNPLKRTPSNASQSYPSTNEDSPRVPLDPKKAKKEAAQAAKEAEKMKREMMQNAARERARAVMKKKNQLMEAADPLHNFSNHTRPAAPDKGKQRAERSPRDQMASGGKMPQIVEDTSRLHVSDNRHKARRRDVDDDVHSVSSNETGHSSHRGRPFSVSGVSISSVATSASDPERRSQHQYDFSPQRVPSLSSLTSSSSRPYHHQAGFRHAVPPSTGHSSLDHSLITNMQGLATSGDGWRSPSGRSERSESRGARASSPRDAHSHHGEQRYSPYPFASGSSGRSPGPQLPPITTFDPSQYRTKSSAASVRSTPSILPSYLGRTTQDGPPPSVVQGLAPTFPYQSPPPTGA